MPEIQAAVAGIAHDFPPKELSLASFKGEPFWLTDEAPDRIVFRSRTRTEDAPRRHRLISAIHPDAGAFARFDNAALEQVARDAMPGVAITDAVWLDE